MLSEGEVGRVPFTQALPILIYNGQCSICCRWVARVRKWDKEGALRYVPLQDARAPEMSGREREALEQAVHLVRSDGVVFAGAAAAREMMGYLPGGSVPKSVLSVAPLRWIAARAYAWIARRYGPVRPTAGG
jgi:predicted DCC family thiol-disulfide oxidoreductase YuxK